MGLGLESEKRHCGRSLETLDSDADLWSLAVTGWGSESGKGSRPISLAMTLVERRCLSPSSFSAAAAVLVVGGICLG